MRRLTTLVALVLALGAAVGCGDDDDEGAGQTTAPTPTVAETETAPESEGGCTEVEQPDPKPDGGEERPPGPLTGDGWRVTFQTNCGSFTVDIDEEASGRTGASFVQLAENGFYDDTYFHRIAPGFVIQGGDPTGTGTGGPGYTTRNAPPSDATYEKGTVAMAKGGAEPPGTAGSQFFVMTGDTGLPPEYAIVGEVSRGMDVVDRIAQLGDAAETPTLVVKVEKATVRSGG